MNCENTLGCVCRINRRARQTTRILGVTIPAGCGVDVPIHNIMHDPEFFDDPDKFRPDRYKAHWHKIITKYPGIIIIVVVIIIINILYRE